MSRQSESELNLNLKAESERLELRDGKLLSIVYNHGTMLFKRYFL